MYSCINDIKVGKMDDIIVMVKSINTLTAKNGNTYQKLVVRDREGVEETFIQFDCILDIPTPIIMKITVECSEYGANLAFKIKESIETDEFTMDDFLPKAHVNNKAEWSKIVKATKTIRPSLCRVVCAIIGEDKNRFMAFPLNPTGAFARKSGNIEATSKLMELAEVVAKQNSLDRDLIVSAAILYYNGSLETVDEGYSSTVTNLMFGPAVSGYTKVQLKAAELIAGSEEARNEIDSQDIMMLGHILAVRDGHVKPAFPEAAALAQLDKMIQEVDMMNEIINNAPEENIINANNGTCQMFKRI